MDVGCSSTGEDAHSLQTGGGLFALVEGRVFGYSLTENANSKAHTSETGGTGFYSRGWVVNHTRALSGP